MAPISRPLDPGPQARAPTTDLAAKVQAPRPQHTQNCETSLTVRCFLVLLVIKTDCEQLEKLNFPSRLMHRNLYKVGYELFDRQDTSWLYQL